ncbi:hypothetical protein [Bacillus cereus]|uniref:hypothetical protein n=1 Tax=Bacillus cereus TaxID=1396 RepID=UPI000BF87ED5|nr:hypothetical protein [Bacillus cereus]PFI17291.1 hypothetical protein COI75_20540 [Bacillus cereus]
MLKKVILSSTILMGVLGVSAVSLPDLGLIKAEAAISDAKIQKVSVFGQNYYDGSDVPGNSTGTFYIVGDKNVTYTIKQYEFNRLVNTKSVTTIGLNSPALFNMQITEGNKYEVTYNGKVISTFVVRGH